MRGWPPVPRRDQLWALAVSALLLGVTVWPAFRDPTADSFPHSTYPMFSYERADTLSVVTQVLAVLEDGRRVPLGPLLSTGNTEVLQSQATIVRAVRLGAETSERLCSEIAARVGRSAQTRDIVRIELATSRFRTLEYFSGDRSPVGRMVHHACEVPP